MLEKTNMAVAPKAIINAIITLYNEKKYDEVLSRVSGFLLKYPNTCVLHNILGAIYFEKGNKDKALKFFKKVVDINAHHPHGYNNLGAVLIEIKEYKEALLVFKKAIKLNPNYAEAYNNIGIVYQELKKYNKAIDNYNKAIELNPDYYEAYNNMGVALCKNEKYEKAENLLKKAIRIKPEFIQGFNTLANILFNLKKFKEAEKLLKKVIKKNPKYTDCYNILGNVLINLHRYDEAEQILKESIKIKPQNKDAFFYLGDLYSRKQISKSAIKYFKKALIFDSENANIFYNLGVNFSKIGEFKKASNNLKKSLQINPTNQVALHVYNSILGRKTKSAPKDYIIGLFDHYAKNFEQSLIDNLDYQIPKKIKNLLLEISSKSLGSILDLGCGTGLVGYELKKHCKYLEGIDLSSNMIEEARKKNIYDRLVQTELIDYLKTKTLDFDYFIAADVFIYVGDLYEVFKLISERNKKTGNLVFSVEHTDAEGYFLEKTGRYSHSENYINNLCDNFNCSIIEFKETKIRKEKYNYVDGAIYNIKF